MEIRNNIKPDTWVVNCDPIKLKNIASGVKLLSVQFFYMVTSFIEFVLVRPATRNEELSGIEKCS